LQVLREKIIASNGIAVLLNGLAFYFENRSENEGIQEVLLGILENLVGKSK
jgi:hypothetical protein